MPRFMDKLGRALLASRPEQDLSCCVQCGRCAQICPAGALVLDGKKLRFDYSKCIRCYCCHEMCPRDAIVFREGALMKLFKTFAPGGRRNDRA
jgi:ferredoxin